MRIIVKNTATVAWIGVAFTMLACQLGGADGTQDLQEAPSATAAVENVPLMKPSPTPGEVPTETVMPTSGPTAAPAPDQGSTPASTPPGGGGNTASAEVITTAQFVSADGVFHVIGTIVNNGDLPVAAIEVSYDVMDRDGIVMDTITGYPGYYMLFPGEITPFEAEFVDPFPREVGDVGVRLEGDAMSFAELNQNSYLNSFTHEFEVVRIEGRLPDVGDYEIVGEVKNASGQSVTDADVTVMLFDAADNLLGVETSIIPDKYVIGQGILLASGETSTFDAWFGTLAEGGDVARIEVGFEAVKTE
jgi:hypothetical protein